MASSIVPTTFGVFDGAQSLWPEWHTSKAAVIACELAARYAHSQGRAGDFTVLQGGYDADSGDKVVRRVYPTRTPWRLV